MKNRINSILTLRHKIMKKLVFILLVIFAGLSYLNEVTTKKGENIISRNTFSPSSDSLFSKSESKTVYDLKVNFQKDESTIFVKEIVFWKNTGNTSTKELKFYLYPNAYRKKNSKFFENPNLSKEQITEVEFTKFKVNFADANILNDLDYSFDSTVVTAKLSEAVKPGHSTNIEISYKMEIPKSVNGLGYSKAKEFYSFINWYPKLGVYRNGKWLCEPDRNFRKQFSEPAEYHLVISTTQNFDIISNAELVNRDSSDKNSKYEFRAEHFIDIAWFAVSDILFQEKKVNGIPVKAYVQPERERYIRRYFDTIENSLAYLKKNIGQYPFNNLILLDTPKASEVSGRVFPGMLTIRSDLISPPEIHELEYPIAKGITKIYFGNTVINKCISENWLSDGPAIYLADKIVHRYYGNGIVHFNIANYYPIYGLNFLSYDEIPIIYTLGIFNYQEGTRSLQNYYTETNLGSISEPSKSYPNKDAFEVNSKYKPALMFLSLERILGEKNLIQILSKYFDENKLKVTGQEILLTSLQRESKKNLEWFFENIFFKSAEVDYRINEVFRVNDSTHEVFAEKRGEGFFETEVALYTENDTLTQIWKEDNNWEKFIFHTNDKVIAAEIDPERKNIFDLDYANNSYTAEQQHWVAWSLSIRWLFWVQNALMILGGIG